MLQIFYIFYVNQAYCTRAFAFKNYIVHYTL